MSTWALTNDISNFAELGSAQLKLVYIIFYWLTNIVSRFVSKAYATWYITFVFCCWPKSCFLTIFDIFFRDRHTDWSTDRPTNVGIEAPSLKILKLILFCSGPCVALNFRPTPKHVGVRFVFCYTWTKLCNDHSRASYQ